MSFDDKKISEIIKSFKGYFGKFDRNNVIAHVLAQSAESRYKSSISEEDKNSEDIQTLIDTVISSVGGATMMHPATNQITEGAAELSVEEKGILTILDEFFKEAPSDSSLSPLVKAFKDGEFVRICTNKPMLPNASLENIIHPFPNENISLASTQEVTINDILGSLADEDQYVLDGDPSRQNPGISIIDLARPELARTTNNASIAAIWAAGIPSIELSQCVPYLDIKFYDPSIEAVNPNNRTLGFNPSVSKFILGGRKELSPEEYNFASSTLADPIRMHSGFDQNQKADIPSVAGMEMFTMPQTYQGKREPYVDLNPEGMPNSNRPNSILDPFRPFLTINGFDITVESANTILTFMHGTLSMTLGDRSRLHEIAALIKPDRMNHLEIIAEWGWSHPNQESQYGKLLNASRQKRKFMITTADFTFNTDGTVAITMKIAARGAERITRGLMSQVGAVELNKITRLISELRDKVRAVEKNDIKVSKALFGNDDMMGLFTTVDNVLTIDKKTIDKIKKKLRKNKNTADPDFAEMRNMLLSTSENKDGDTILESVVSYKQAVTDAFAKLTSALKDENKIGGSDEVIVDPWALKWEHPICKAYMDNVYGKRKSDKKDDRISSRHYVSFGRLIMLFVGTALVDNKMWDDIQIMFYGFNDNSYGLHNLQISEFPIPVEEFETAFTNWREDKRNPSLLQFISWVARTFISRKDNPAWGLTKAFRRKKNEAGQYITERETKTEKEFKQKIQTASNLIYGEGTMMKIKSPSIRVDVETLESTGSRKRSIFRMHIYDAAQDTYRGYTQIIKAMQNTASGLIAKAPEKTSMKGGANSTSVESMKQINKALEKALGLGLLKEVSHEDRMSNKTDDPDHENHIANTKLYRISAAPGQIKYFISSNMPTLKYGTDGSVIKTAAISKTSDPQYAMIQMQKRNMGNGPKVPTSLETGDFPMRINPVSLTLETIGCPFFRHGQMFFFDFQTNTDVDNAYMLTGINHKISDSDYSTSLQLTSIDRYGVIENLNDQLAELDTMFLEAAKKKED